jgi:hypothetical protein
VFEVFFSFVMNINFSSCCWYFLKAVVSSL